MVPSKTVFHLQLHQCTCKSKLFQYDYRLHFQGFCADMFICDKHIFVLEISESLFAVSQSITFVISQLTEFCNFLDYCHSELKLEKA